jgi:hypothetical protein
VEKHSPKLHREEGVQTGRKRAGAYDGAGKSFFFEGKEQQKVGRSPIRFLFLLQSHCTGLLAGFISSYFDTVCYYSSRSCTYRRLLIVAGTIYTPITSGWRYVVSIDCRQHYTVV